MAQAIISILAERDPFWAEGLDGRKGAKPNPERVAAIEAQIADLAEKYGHYGPDMINAAMAGAKVGGKPTPIVYGPLLDSLFHLFERFPFVAGDQLWLMHTQDKESRYEAFRKVARHKHKGLELWQPPMISRAFNPGDLTACYRSISSVMSGDIVRERLAHFETVHVLLSSGSPQMRWALLLWVFEARPTNVRVWEYKRADLLKQDENPLVELRFDGSEGGLPLLTVGSQSDVVTNLRREVDALRQQIDARPATARETADPVERERGRIFRAFAECFEARGADFNQSHLGEKLGNVSQARASQSLRIAKLRWVRRRGGEAPRLVEINDEE